MNRQIGHINVIGAGLSGPLLALLLARQGHSVRIFDRGADPRTQPLLGGRSINLALAARGLRALSAAGLTRSVQPLLVPMRGRMVHEGKAAPRLLPYGQRPHEVIYSVSRRELNLLLIAAADTEPTVEFRFAQRCLGARPQYNVLHFEDGISGRLYETDLAPSIAADGAGSAIRNSLVASGLIEASEELLEHDYKELNIPPECGAELARDALHVWPRGDFMLIALPNTDGSFTATLFLPRDGPVSFATLRSPADLDALFREQFPDAQPLLPDLAADYFRNPQGIMGTVRCSNWHVGGQLLLLGDAAHAMVPFHAQGMNAAFEDCHQLAEQFAGEASCSEVFARFTAERRSHTDAISRMAVENFLEMRATVREPLFLQRKQLALALERAHPERFVPRYSMVMFHPEIGYADARARGEVQQQILAQLIPVPLTDTAQIEALAHSAAAAELVSSRLPRIDVEHRQPDLV
ncbi:MAG: NAD(P)/FAD-dependent oxidoreductase [Steroidobacteraceae bacterium]